MTTGADEERRRPPTPATLPTGTTQAAGRYPSMKMVKAIRKQAATAERVAASTADTFVASQMRSLAQAFRSQAEIIKKKNKKKKK